MAAQPTRAPTHTLGSEQKALGFGAVDATTPSTFFPKGPLRCPGSRGGQGTAAQRRRARGRS
jgi:hypothetical protein